MPSFISKIQKYIPFSSGRIFRGYDLQGNKFYEYPTGLGGRMRRVVKYRFINNIADYTSGQARLPIQWTTWLSYTRHDPPTLEELRRDAVRQNGLTDKVAEIEQREKEERIRQGYITGQEPVQLHSGTKFGALAGSRIRSAPSFSDRAVQQPQQQPQQQQQQLERPAMGQPPQPTPTSQPTIPWPSTAQPSPSQQQGQSHTPQSPAIPAAPQPVDPTTHHTAEDLRKLAEEDTRRRIAASGGETTTKDTGVQGVVTGSGGLQPRRRRQAAA